MACRLALPLILYSSPSLSLKNPNYTTLARAQTHWHLRPPEFPNLTCFSLIFSPLLPTCIDIYIVDSSSPFFLPIFPQISTSDHSGAMSTLASAWTMKPMSPFSKHKNHVGSTLSSTAGSFFFPACLNLSRLEDDVDEDDDVLLLFFLGNLIRMRSELRRFPLFLTGHQNNLPSNSNFAVSLKAVVPVCN